MSSPAPASSPESAAPPGISLLPLLLAIAVMLIVSIRPDLLSDAQGRANHSAAVWLCAGMAAGFVRGVGFVPRLRIWRYLFSTPLCLLGIAVALWLLWAGG